MAYIKKIWKDYPDTSTPITADDLNNIENGIAGVLDWIYPVGTIYETTSTDLDTVAKMATHFGGTWEAYGAGKVLVAKSSDTEFNTIGKTGGEKTHTLTIPEIPEHYHIVGIEGYGFVISNSQVTVASGNQQYSNNGVRNETAATGGNGAHNNLSPYIVVYRYRRTA